MRLIPCQTKSKSNRLQSRSVRRSFMYIMRPFRSSDLTFPEAHVPDDCAHVGRGGRWWEMDHQSTEVGRELLVERLSFSRGSRCLSCLGEPTRQSSSSTLASMGPGVAVPSCCGAGKSPLRSSELRRVSYSPTLWTTCSAPRWKSSAFSPCRNRVSRSWTEGYKGS